MGIFLVCVDGDEPWCGIPRYCRGCSTDVSDEEGDPSEEELEVTAPASKGKRKAPPSAKKAAKVSTT